MSLVNQWCVSVGCTAPQEKKALSNDFIRMIVAATVAKSGGGRGVKLAKFNALQHMQIHSKIERSVEGGKAAFKTFSGCENHWRIEYGWTAARSMDEFKYLQATLPKKDQDRTYDRVSGKPVDWILIDLERYRTRERITEDREEAWKFGARWANRTPSPMYRTQYQCA
jgi:hypothetical protein